MTYNQVVPPVLPAPTAKPTPLPTGPAVSSPSTEIPQKAYQSVFFSATVYDRQLTDLRWNDGDRSYRAFSTIDFNFLLGMGQFETPDTIYSYSIPLFNETTKSTDPATVTLLAQVRQQLAASLSANAPSAYVIVGDAPPESSNVCSALDAIHAYFDANRDQLISGYQKRIASAAAQAEWQRAHPSVQQNTVINFWRKTGGALPQTGN